MCLYTNRKHSYALVENHCDPIVRLLPDGRSIQFATDLMAIIDYWPDRFTASDLFMSADYLLALQSNAPPSLRFMYAILCDPSEQQEAYFYFQFKDFKASDALNYSEEAGWRAQLIQVFKRLLARLVHVQGMVSGNLLVTGNHGVMWHQSSSPPADWQTTYAMVIAEAKVFARENNLPYRYLMCKDYQTPAQDHSPIQWQSAQVQPKMVLELAPHWQDIEDYLGDMSSKYRRRIRNALRKVADCTFRFVNAAELAPYLDQIYVLYLQIVERAPFNMFVLPRDYFLALLEALPEATDCVLLLDESDKLLAFQMQILNGSSYEAHFLGYDHDRLKEYDLYLNLLLCTVRRGIELGAQNIQFSRTAMQIKSSIGAVPHDIFIYVQSDHRWINPYFSRIIHLLDPPVTFDQRHPFRDHSGPNEGTID